MATLKNLSSEEYNYKNLTITRIDTIEEGFSSITAYAKREWLIDNKKAFTVDIEGATYLAYYPSTSKTNKIALKDFSPECGFYLNSDNEVVKQALTELNKCITNEML